MPKEVILIRCKPSPAPVNVNEQMRNTRLVHQLTGCVSRLNVLLDRARAVLNNPDAFDFVEDVPALMSEIYLHYLRTGAIRQQLDAEYLSELVIDSLPDVWAVQAEAGEILEALSDLFDDEADYGESYDEEDSEGICDDNDNEDESDCLCTVSIEVAECVPDHIVQRIYQNIDAAITCAFRESECAHRSCPMYDRCCDRPQEQPRQFSGRSNRHP